MVNSKNIPVYSLAEFSKADKRTMIYQVEVFDANRHFQVSYPHKHDFYEVLFLAKGSGFHVIDGNKYEIKPPCIFFMSPGQTHRLEFSQDIDGFIFLFTSEFYLLNEINKNKLMELPFFFSVEQMNPPLILEKADDVVFLKSLFIKGCQEVDQQSKISEDIIRSILDLLLQTCKKLYQTDAARIQNTRGHLLVKNLLKLIEENYQKNLSIDEYAGMLSITPNHLTQLVKQVTGKTSAKLLQSKIIIETKRMLIHSEMTVSEIADYMNFTDQSYFTKYFKKACGITPLQYRKSKR